MLHKLPSKRKELQETIFPRLKTLYGDQRAHACWAALEEAFDTYEPLLQQSAPALPPSEKDVALIAYADHISDGNRSPLHVLHTFLEEQGWYKDFSIVHLLPFFPFSSDGGFSVVDYLQVDPNKGTWEDIKRFSEKCKVMFDFVLNHASAKSDWFTKCCASDPEFQDFFISVPPGTNVQSVLRPRSHPLLTEFPTANGPKLFWTTFSTDQIDLSYKNPLVLAKMITILLEYLSQGAKLIRLDAVNYLWKELETSCSHLPQTHLVVKILRDIVNILTPDVLLVSETNVPHKENITYFGEGDEAHIIYNFSLPPLLADALFHENTEALQNWATQLEVRNLPGYMLNFSASHDGVGLRPLQGLVPEERIEKLIEAVQAHGGRISTRTDSNGNNVPYEMNITWYDMMQAKGLREKDIQRKFLTSQAIVAAMKGIPAVYFPSVFGGRNFLEGVSRTGKNRVINRRKYTLKELHDILQQQDQKRITTDYRNLLTIRKSLSAFHPEAEQRTIPFQETSLFGFQRKNEADGSSLIHLSNVGRNAVACKTSFLAKTSVDLFTQQKIEPHSTYTLEPFQTLWLKPASK